MSLSCVLSTALAVGIAASGQAFAQAPLAGDGGPVPMAQATESPGPPLVFIANEGQWQDPSRFIAQRGRMAVRLLSDGIVLTTLGESRAGVVHLTFEGARPAAVPVPAAEPSANFSFFLGNDPGRWRERVPAYTQVRYDDLYDGIDLFISAAGPARLEWRVAPHADVSRLALRIEGAERVEIGPGGELVIQTELGAFRQRPPRCWEPGPAGSRREVESRFEIRDSGVVGLSAPARRTHQALVVETALDWSTYLGGNFTDRPNALAQTADGNIAVVGTTISTSGFPITPGA